MAKNTKKLTQYYRWQFLRLNEYYQRNYDWFNDYCNNYFKYLPKATEKNKQDFIMQENKRFFEEYGINNIYDYKLENPSEDLVISGEADIAVRKGSLKELFGTNLQENEMITGGYLLERRIIKEKRLDNKSKREVDVVCSLPKYVQLIIDCDAKENEIISGVLKIVKGIKEQRKLLFKIKRPRKIRKNNEGIKDYKRYLKVYELRINKKLPLKQIAKIIYPKSYSNNPSSYEDRIRKVVGRTRQLINGEYRKIIL